MLNSLLATILELHLEFLISLLTKISDNLLDHISEHASAVLRVEKREELLFIQQLIGWRVICLKPAIL